MEYAAALLGERIDYPKHAVWQFLQALVEEGRVIRYEEVEIPHAGVEIYYALPARGESSFHKALIGKAYGVLADVFIRGREASELIEFLEFGDGRERFHGIYDGSITVCSHLPYTLS